MGTAFAELDASEMQQVDGGLSNIQWLAIGVGAIVVIGLIGIALLG